jgi:hypothetical protein
VIDAFMLRAWNDKANDSGMDRVVRVREDFARPGQPPDIRGFSVSSLGPWRRNNTVFEDLAASPNAHGTPPLPILPEVSEELNNFTQRLALMEVTPQEELPKIQERLQKKYDKFVANQKRRKSIGQ